MIDQWMCSTTGVNQPLTEGFNILLAFLLHLRFTATAFLFWNGIHHHGDMLAAAPPCALVCRRKLEQMYAIKVQHLREHVLQVPQVAFLHIMLDFDTRLSLVYEVDRVLFTVTGNAVLKHCEIKVRINEI